MIEEKEIKIEDVESVEILDDHKIVEQTKPPKKEEEPKPKRTRRSRKKKQEYQKISQELSQAVVKIPYKLASMATKTKDIFDLTQEEAEAVGSAFKGVFDQYLAKYLAWVLDKENLIKFITVTAMVTYPKIKLYQTYIKAKKVEDERKPEVPDTKPNARQGSTEDKRGLEGSGEGIKEE